MYEARGPAGSPLTRDMLNQEEESYVAGAPEENNATFYTPKQAREINFFALPIGAGPNDQLLASDDPTVYTYQMPSGDIYYVPTYAVDQSLSEPRSVSEAATRAVDYIPSVSEAWDMAKAIPGEAWGTIDRAVNGGATFGDVAAIAGGMAGTGAPMVAPEGAVGMFIGRRANLTPEQNAGLSTAAYAARSDPTLDASPELWESTGWNYNPDERRWYSEIDDSEAKFNFEAPALEAAVQQYGTTTARFGDAFDHPLFFQNYPAIADMTLVFKPTTDKHYDGAFRNGNTLEINVPASGPFDMDAIKSVLLHEAQHAVQLAEGWRGQGMNPDWVAGKGDNHNFEGVLGQSTEVDNYVRNAGMYNRASFEEDLIFEYENNPRQVYQQLKNDTGLDMTVRDIIMRDYEGMTGMRPTPASTSDAPQGWGAVSPITLDEYKQVISEEAERLYQDLGTYNLPDNVTGPINTFLEQVQPTTFVAYRSEAGEKGARNTQVRGALTQLERRAAHPPSTEDLQTIPTWYYDEQIKRRDAAAQAIRQYLGKTGNSPTTSAGAAPSPNSTAPRYTSPTYPRKEPLPSTNTNQGNVVATYRSPVAEVAANMTIPNGGIKGSQFIKELHDNPSVRNSEVKALGLNIDPQRRYTREEMQQIVDASTYRVEARAGGNQYRSTQRQPVTDPETDYQELIVTGARGFDDDPNKPSTFRARGQHYTDDTLAHTRFSVRSSDEGNYILVEEIQSDLVQAGWERQRDIPSTFADWMKWQYRDGASYPALDLEEFATDSQMMQALQRNSQEKTNESRDNIARLVVDRLPNWSQQSRIVRDLIGDYEDFNKVQNQPRVSDPPITNEREYTRALVQGIMGYAEQNGIDEIVFPPFERIVAQRFKPGTPEYDNALSEKSGFYRTYVSSLNNTIAELQDEFGAENIDVGTRALTYSGTTATMSPRIQQVTSDFNRIQNREYDEDFLNYLQTTYGEGYEEIPTRAALMHRAANLPTPPAREEGIYIDISKLRQNYDLTRPRFKDGGLVTQTTQALGGAI